jgi:hypothetical protein
MSGFVIDFDLTERQRGTGRSVVSHHRLHPCGGRREAEATASNLRLNHNVSDAIVTATEEDGERDRQAAST